MLAHDEKARHLLEIVTRILSFYKMPVIESPQKKEEPKEKTRPKAKTDNFIVVAFGCKSQF